MSEQDILTAAADLEIGISSEFVPHSKSRNAKEAKCLNWKVTLSVKGHVVLTTDYSAGIAHCPSYRQGDESFTRSNMVYHEVETGHDDTSRKPFLPKMADVLSSLVSDARAIDAGSFEEWCSDMGASPDSRKAEAIYHHCVGLGLKLRSFLGDEGLAKLQLACQDY
jgi:hypothetical protein